MAEETMIPGSRESRPDHNSDFSGTTPPEQQSQLPPTPPATDERRDRASDASFDDGLMHMLRHRAEGILAPLTVIRIDQKQYDRNRQEIENLFRRHDYEPKKGRIVIRMPSAIHEFFLKSFERALEDSIKSIADGGGDAGDFASEIKSVGCARIFLAEGSNGPSSKALRRQPDAQYQHSQTAYPGVVVEVSYSQDGKALRKLALDYILESNGNIRAVIGIDINPRGKESTVSLWRPEYTPSEDEGIEVLEARQVVSHMPFRTAEGAPTNQEECLTLYLGDFTPDEESSGYESLPLSIAFDSLYNFLTQAESLQQKRDSGGGFKSVRRTKRRRPSSSPVEQLRSDDEEKYVLLEKAAAHRAESGDVDFSAKAPSAKRRG